MPNTPTSSFIPKQGPAKRSHQVVSRQVHLFTVLSYVLFFGSLVASAGAFFYERHVENQLRNEVIALDSAIANFSTEKMEQVKAFNLRLQYAQGRIVNSVSAVSIFDSLEDSMVQAAALDSLTLKRIEDQKFLVTAHVNTDTFDSVLFQRGLYERNPVIEAVAFEDISLGKADGEEVTLESGVSFKAELEVPISSVPYKPQALPISTATTDVATTSSDTVTDSSSKRELPDNTNE